MARKLRIQYPGAIYHVMNRGDRREAIFRDDRDREVFVASLAEACVKADWQVHAYSLMGNHFHLVVETPQGNLVAGMHWFLGTYTARFNRRHGLVGHLFSGRYKSLVPLPQGSVQHIEITSRFSRLRRMARKLRIQYPGAIYHVMNRGDRREAIFSDDRDREVFVASLAEACMKADWQVHAYCLMGNHFHLVIETPQGNLVAGMHWFLGTYTARFNRRHGLVGHLFSGRYKSLVVDGASPGYLRTACEYVHLNPVRANLLRPEEPLRAYSWSSYPSYLDRPGRRAPWLRVERVLGGMGIPRDSAAGRRQFERVMEERRAQDRPEEYERLRRGWCWGEEAFRKELLAQVEEKRGASHYGAELQESATEKAERLVCEGLERLGWTEADLAARRKGDLAKVEIALKLRTETTMTLKWTAARLQMGTGASLSNLLSARRPCRSFMED